MIECCDCVLVQTRSSAPTSISGTAEAKPFIWTATADEILAKVKLVQTNIKHLVDNNAK